MRPPSKRQGRLSHRPPLSVDTRGAILHVRIRVTREQRTPLTDPTLAPAILDSVIFNARTHVWWPTLFLLMPDHLHALLSFGIENDLSRTVGAWKRWLTKTCDIRWQDNFFDHRIRNDESLDEKTTYIRMNPVVKGLCEKPDDWPWVLDEPQIRERLALQP